MPRFASLDGSSAGYLSDADKTAVMSSLCDVVMSTTETGTITENRRQPQPQPGVAVFEDLWNHQNGMPIRSTATQ
jgi:hypothetical protein